MKKMSIKRFFVTLSSVALLNFSSFTSNASVDLSGLKSLESLGTSIFSGCSSVTDVNLSGLSKLKSIGKDAFSGCDSLVSVDLSGAESLKSIEAGTFSGCSNLKSLNLSGMKSLKNIDKGAFSGCYNLISIDLSGAESLKSIEADTFSGCSNLKSLNLSGCDSLVQVDLSKLANLEKITVPDTIPVESITLPENSEAKIEVKSKGQDEQSEVKINDISVNPLIYGQKLSDTKINGYVTLNGKNVEGNFSFVNPNEKPGKPRNGKEEVQEYEIEFKSNDGKISKKITVPVTVKYWGEMNTRLGYQYWVDSDGKTSTLIGDDDVTWLYEESIDHYEKNADGSDNLSKPVYTSAWYGVSNFRKMNGDLLFEKGSKFWVIWHDENSPEYKKYYSQLDEETKEKLQGERWLFEVGVTKPDGTEYTNLGDLTKLFIQYGSDWDENDFEAFYISPGKDEKVAHINTTLPMDGISCPEKGMYATLLLNHFSPYILGKYSGKSSNENDILTYLDDNYLNNSSSNLGSYSNPYTGNSKSSSSTTSSGNSKYNTGEKDTVSHVVHLFISTALLLAICKILECITKSKASLNSSFDDVMVNNDDFVKNSPDSNNQVLYLDFSMDKISELSFGNKFSTFRLKRKPFGFLFLLHHKQSV